MEEHLVDSIDLDTHTHDEVDDGYALSSKTEYENSCNNTIKIKIYI